MPIIRRTSGDDGTGTVQVTINSSSEDIHEAIDTAKKRFMSLSKNRGTVFGKLLTLIDDPRILFPERDLDIVAIPSAMRSYIEGASGFYKVELGARMKGQIKNKSFVTLVQQTLNHLTIFSKGNIEIDSVIKVDSVTAFTLIGKASKKKVVIKISDTGIYYETGITKKTAEQSSAIRGAMEL